MKKALSIVLTALMFLTAFGSLTVLADAAPTYQEAPALASRVEKGELPPVEERLPKNPMVLTKELNAIPQADMDFVSGEYGGILRMADPSTENGMSPEVWCFTNEPPLFVPGIDVLGEYDAGHLVGNWLEGYEANDDNTVFTFTIREGLKWSDGVPVTTEDVAFAFEDYYNYVGLSAPPAWLYTNSNPSEQPGVCEIIDTLSFKITFTKPYPLLPVYLADPWNTYTLLVLPKHFLSQYHIKYADPDALAKELEANSLEPDGWITLFNLKNNSGRNMNNHSIDCPTLSAWRFSGSPSQGVYTYERNPYYYKVDYEGKQLPYIDGIEHVWVTDLKGQTMKAVSSEVDFAVNRTNTSDFPLFMENSAEFKPEASYNVVLLEQHVTPTDIFLNLTFEDEVWRQVTGNVDFRRALNHAINRDSIIETVQLGYATYPDVPAVPYEYDVAKANALLDSLTDLGLDKRDAEGWRLGPDGNRFQIDFEVAIFTVGNDQVTEMVAADWREVGIYTTVKVIDTALNAARRNGNTLKGDCFWLDMHVWPLNPTSWARSLQVVMDNWGIMWKNWYFNHAKDPELVAKDEDGNPVKFEEPPENVKEFMSAMEDAIQGDTKEERDAALAKAQQLLSDNVFFFPISTGGYPMIYNKNMGNIPVNTRWGINAAYSGEQFFFKSAE